MWVVPAVQCHQFGLWALNSCIQRFYTWYTHEFCLLTSRSTHWIYTQTEKIQSKPKHPDRIIAQSKFRQTCVCTVDSRRARAHRVDEDACDREPHQLAPDLSWWMRKGWCCLLHPVIAPPLEQNPSPQLVYCCLLHPGFAPPLEQICRLVMMLSPQLLIRR
jgi:hypothetical protein